MANIIDKGAPEPAKARTDGAPDLDSPAMRRQAMIADMVERVMANHPGLTREEALEALDDAGF